MNVFSCSATSRTLSCRARRARRLGTGPSYAKCSQLRCDGTPISRLSTRSAHTIQGSLPNTGSPISSLRPTTTWDMKITGIPLTSQFDLFLNTPWIGLLSVDIAHDRCFPVPPALSVTIIYSSEM